MQKNIFCPPENQNFDFWEQLDFKKYLHYINLGGFIMKQKYLSNGKILVEFKYKGVEYKEEFENTEELNSFLESLQEELK